MSVTTIEYKRDSNRKRQELKRMPINRRSVTQHNYAVCNGLLRGQSLVSKIVTGKQGYLENSA